MQLPAWLLVDEHGDIVGSVAAENAHEARRLFKAASPAHGFSRGRWVRKATDAT